jgi:hypothetical protein
VLGKVRGRYGGFVKQSAATRWFSAEHATLIVQHTSFTHGFFKAIRHEGSIVAHHEQEKDSRG